VLLTAQAAQPNYPNRPLEPVGNTPAELAAVIRKEMPEWAKVIKDAGIKLGN
jgi:tripartite-type tricarboxylate transporter receptor subunit TctC